MRLFPKIAFAAASLGLLFSSCKKDDSNPQNPHQQKIVAVAKEQGDLNLFVEAIEKTGLESELNDGTFTVFAPTDSMFQIFLEDLGTTSVDELINREGQQQVRRILQYHILKGGSVRADEFGSSYVYTEATNPHHQRMSLYIARLDTTIILNKNAAKVVKSNIEADNGIIHKVNGVLLLPSLTSLLSVHPDYNTLVNALNNSTGNLTTSFRQENSMFTIFAPTNDAFVNYFNDHPYFNDFNGFIQHYGPDGIRDFMLYHALDGNHRAEDLTSGSYQTMLENENFLINKGTNGIITITDNKGDSAKVVINNITAVNGVIHRINYLLSPYN